MLLKLPSKECNQPITTFLNNTTYLLQPPAVRVEIICDFENKYVRTHSNYGELNPHRAYGMALRSTWIP